jgi:hypothetical protein
VAERSLLKLDVAGCSSSSSAHGSTLSSSGHRSIISMSPVPFLFPSSPHSNGFKANSAAAAPPSSTSAGADNLLASSVLPAAPIHSVNSVEDALKLVDAKLGAGAEMENLLSRLQLAAQTVKGLVSKSAGV